MVLEVEVCDATKA